MKVNSLIFYVGQNLSDPKAKFNLKKVVVIPFEDIPKAEKSAVRRLLKVEKDLKMQLLKVDEALRALAFFRLFVSDVPLQDARFLGIAYRRKGTIGTGQPMVVLRDPYTNCVYDTNALDRMIASSWFMIYNIKSFVISDGAFCDDVDWLVMDD